MVGIFTTWCRIPHSKRTRYASGAGLASCRQDSPVLRTWEILQASGLHQIEVGIPQYVRTREIPNLDPSLRLFRFAEDASLHPPEHSPTLPYMEHPHLWDKWLYEFESSQFYASIADIKIVFKPRRSKQPLPSILSLSGCTGTSANKLRRISPENSNP